MIPIEKLEILISVLQGISLRIIDAMKLHEVELDAISNSSGFI